MLAGWEAETHTIIDKIRPSHFSPRPQSLVGPCYAFHKNNDANMIRDAEITDRTQSMCNSKCHNERNIVNKLTRAKCQNKKTGQEYTDR